MESVKNHALKEILSEFEDLEKNFDEYAKEQLEISEKYKQIVSKLYGLKENYNLLKDLKYKSLLKLLVDGFDEEQIWQQIEIDNNVAIPHISKVSPKINAADLKSSLKLLIDGFGEEQVRQLNENQNNAADASIVCNGTNICQKTASADDDTSSEKDSNVKEDYVFDDDSDSSTDMVEAKKSRKNSVKDKEYSCQDDFSATNKVKTSYKKEDYAFDEDSDSSTNMVEAENTRDNSVKDEEYFSEDDFPVTVKAKNEKSLRKKKKSTASYKSEVDDQFFKLSNLEEFLRIEDLKEEKEVSDEDDIDLFQNIPSEDENECVEEQGHAKKDIMYEDFFDAPESGDESIGCTEDQNEVESVAESDYCSGSAFDEDLGKDEDDDETMENLDQKDNLEVEDVQEPLKNSNQKTAFEIEQEKIKKKIQECEESMLKPLPWHLTGEVDASKRPVDSLVHKDADFDSNTKQDLVVDQELTEKVENIIKLAIRNKAFCDVERKVKPTEEVIAYKKQVTLDQTKSKKSLAEVYEEDYLKKQSKQEEEEDPKHKEIKKLMDSLFPELHALFSHIPKPAIPEIKIVSNLRAVTVEEVAPTSISDVTLLAPEEVKEKSGLVKGISERTDTDKKRERRKKKIHQRLKEKKREEKLEAQKANPSVRISKSEKLETLKKLKQNKNTKIASVDEGGKIKSSKDFFSRLQDTMDSKTKTKTQVPFKKKKS